MHAGSFRVPAIHRILIWTTGSLIILTRAYTHGGWHIFYSGKTLTIFSCSPETDMMMGFEPRVMESRVRRSKPNEPPRVTPCHPMSPHVTPCHPMSPLSPHVTPCHPVSPRVTPCHPCHPVSPPVTPCHPCHPVPPHVTHDTPCHPCHPVSPLSPDMV